MKFPDPWLPKGCNSWSIRNRQRFAKYYWNPWWKLKHFFNKWVSVGGVLLFLDIVTFDLNLKIYSFRMDWERKHGKEKGKQKEEDKG